MPAFTRELERTLRKALSIAGEKGQGQAGSAHLALALTDDTDVRWILRACDVDVATLKVTLGRLADAVQSRPAAPREMPVPAAAFNRAIQRAVVQAQANGREHIAGPQVLIALLSEPNDDTVGALWQAGVTRFHATRYVSHGLRMQRDQNDTPPTPTCDPDEIVRVLLLNDDFTPMAFVVDVLRDAFGKDEGEASRLMLHIHKHGFAECGAYLPEEAAARVAAVAKLARDRQHPLHCVMEPTRGLSDALLFKKPRTIVASGPGDRQRA